MLTFFEKAANWLQQPQIVLLFASCLLAGGFFERLPRAFRWLARYLFFNLFIESSAFLAAVFFKQNLPLLHLYTLGELWLWAFFYRSILDEKGFFRQHFSKIMTVATVLVVSNTAFLQPLLTYNSYAKSFVQVVILLLALDFAFYFTEKPPFRPADERRLRAANAVVLISYSATLFIFMSSKYWEPQNDLQNALTAVNRWINTAFQFAMFLILCNQIFSPTSFSNSRSSGF